MSEEPMTPLLELAVQLHEVLSAYVNAGFTRREALYLVGQQVASATRPGN